MNDKIMKHNEHNMDKAVINIPISVLRSCKDKKSLRIVSLSLFIKAHYGDSLIRNVSIRNLMKALHCGQNKAKECLSCLNNTKFFMPTNSNSFIAKTFKNNITKDYNRKYGVIYKCYCYKMTIEKSWSLRNIETRLRDALLTYAINSKERREISSKCKDNNNDTKPLSNSSQWITFRKLANISGYSRSTARRHIYSLEKDGKVSVKRGSTKILCSSSDEAIKYLTANIGRVTFSKNGLAMIFTPNEYHITDKDLSDSYINIIYNHKKRYTMNSDYENLDFFDIKEQGKYC